MYNFYVEICVQVQQCLQSSCDQSCLSVATYQFINPIHTDHMTKFSVSSVDSASRGMGGAYLLRMRKPRASTVMRQCATCRTNCS